jgi:hypothetical protein
MPVAGGAFDQGYNVATGSLFIVANGLNAGGQRQAAVQGADRQWLSERSECGVLCAAAKIEPLIAMKRECHNARWKERFAEDPKASAASASVMQQMAYRLKTRRGKKLYALRKQTPASRSSGSSNPWDDATVDCR